MKERRAYGWEDKQTDPWMEGRMEIRLDGRINRMHAWVDLGEGVLGGEVAGGGVGSSNGVLLRWMRGRMLWLGASAAK